MSFFVEFVAAFDGDTVEVDGDASSVIGEGGRGGLFVVFDGVPVAAIVVVVFLFYFVRVRDAVVAT